MSKHLVFYVEFNVKPDCVDRFLAGATGVIEAMSKEDSFVTAYLHRDANNPNKFTLIYAEADIGNGGNCSITITVLFN